MPVHGVTRRRVVTTLSVPAVTAVVTALLPVVLADRLPARAFGEGPYPFSQPWSALVVFSPLWIAVLTTVAIVFLVTRSDGVWARGWVALAWGGAVCFVGPVVRAVASNLDVTGPPAHAVAWWAGSWAAVSVALVVAALGWLAAGADGPAPVATRRPAPDAPRLPIGRDERVLWSRSVFSRVLLVCTAAWLVFAAVLALLAMNDQTPTSVALALVVAAVMALQSWVRVRVDGGGVHVVQPLLRRTLLGVRLDEIVEARMLTAGSQDFPKGRYGLLQRTGLTGYRAVRSGPALHLDLADGRRVLVTVPDAGTAAALLNAELDRGREPAC